MAIDNNILEKQLEYAIIERGAIKHLEEYERVKAKIRIRRIRTASYSAAAGLILAACIGGKESFDARSAGMAEDINNYAKSGSVIIAHMNEGNNKAALKEIADIRINRADSPSPDDEWAQYESQELDYLEAVCLLRQGKFISARKALKAIINGNGFFAVKAKSLLDKM